MYLTGQDEELGLSAAENGLVQTTGSFEAAGCVPATGPQEIVEAACRLEEHKEVQ